MKVRVEHEGFDELIADLGKVGNTIRKEGKQVVSRGALNIKKDWQKRWRGHPHIPDLPRAINYDVGVNEARITAEVGPEQNKTSQANMAHIIDEFGRVNVPPLPASIPALAAEAPKFVRAVEDLAVKAVERWG